jgi:hypothetical protein
MGNRLWLFLIRSEVLKVPRSCSWHTISGSAAGPVNSGKTRVRPPIILGLTVRPDQQGCGPVSRRKKLSVRDIWKAIIAKPLVRPTVYHP